MLREGAAYSKPLWTLYLALATIGALGPFAIDTYLPALPQMVEALSACLLYTSDAADD